MCWKSYAGKPMEKRWVTRGQEFFPLWQRKWGHGGTYTTALAQLVRWCGDKPILPLGSWRYWTRPECYLGREAGPQIVETLKAGGYPDEPKCVLCGIPLIRGFCWWSLGGVVGTCCGMSSGCRQDRNWLLTGLLAGAGI